PISTGKIGMAVRFGASVLNRLPSVLIHLVSAPRPSHFLLSGQEKVTKEKATPTSGPGFAGVPSFRCCSGGRHEGTSLSLRSSLGVHASRPPAQHLHSAY